VQRFTGTAYLLEDPDSVFAAEVDLDLNRITVKADGTEIGSWKQAEILVAKAKDRVHLTADGETLVLDLEGRDFFLDMVDNQEPRPTGSRRRRATETEHRKPFSLADIKTQMLEERADQIDRRLALLMLVAAAAILFGAALTWGPFRILDPGGFPTGRLLAAFGGLGGLLAVYLAYVDRSRVTGAAAAIAAGTVTFCIMYLYARAAGLGVGFVLAFLGSQALTTAGVVAMLRRSSSGNAKE
jgi:hypothetical protein